MGLVYYVPEANFYKVEAILRYLYALLFSDRLLIAQTFTSHILLTLHHVDLIWFNLNWNSYWLSNVLLGVFNIDKLWSPWHISHVTLVRLQLSPYSIWRRFASSYQQRKGTYVFHYCKWLLMCTIWKHALERFLKPMEWRLQGLLKMGIHGVTISDVRGFGA